MYNGIRAGTFIEHGGGGRMGTGIAEVRLPISLLRI